MIRTIEKRDIIHCVEIVTENWDTATALRFHAEVKHAFRPGLDWPPEYFVYEDKGRTVAFAGMMPSWIMHEVWDLIWINVKKNYQGLGIGRQLTAHRIKEIKSRDGAVINLMTQSPDFFERFGFYRAFEYKGGWFLMTAALKELAI